MKGIIGFAVLAALAVPAAAQQQDMGAAIADRQAMMDSLGIKVIRQGADGMNPQAPNASNMDEAKAGTPTLPPLLKMNDGRPVTTSNWPRRRAEIVELFDREVYGRVPATAPRITWRKIKEERATEAGRAVIKRWMEGVADNSAWPQASATIALRYTLPEGAKRVPVVLSYGLPENFRMPGPPRSADTSVPYTEQLLKRGWGYAVVVANTIQADNGGGLKDGVIGISLRGKPRGPEDWGVLRAWAWGASRAREALDADPAIDGNRIGIEGLSRYGKAALVAMAYDPKFAIGFIGSSGAGGAALYRRNFGERMGNLAAPSEYHWFAGNFLKYAGPKTEFDLPIDSHMLIALAAPRPVLIGAGTVETGDGWVDPKGMFLAAVEGNPAWGIQGKPGLSRLDFPPVLTPVVGGNLAYRQHQGGHNNRDNWPTFIDFAVAKLGSGPQEKKK